MTLLPHRDRSAITLSGVLLIGGLFTIARGSPAQDFGVFHGMMEHISGSSTSHSILSASSARHGEPYRVRAVLINTSDSIITAFWRPCGIELVTDLELTDRAGSGECDPIERSLAPGDSLWAERSGVVTSPTGSYSVEVRFAGTEPGASMGGFGVQVSPPTTEGVPAQDTRFSPSRKLPYVVTFLTASPESPIDVHDVEEAVQQGLSGGGVLAIPYSRGAGEAIRGSAPYLSVFAAIEPDGGHRVRLCWVGLFERDLCDEYRARARPVGFGARLALETREKLEQYMRRFRADGVPGAEPGSR